MPSLLSCLRLLFVGATIAFALLCVACAYVDYKYLLVQPMSQPTKSENTPSAAASPLTSPSGDTKTTQTNSATGPTNGGEVNNPDTATTGTVGTAGRNNVSTTTVPTPSLEERVAKLEEENKRLEERTEENYPTYAEKNMTHLATAATVVTAEAGVFGVIAAILGTLLAIASATNYVSEFKDKTVDEAYKLATALVSDVHLFIKGRVLLAMGASSGYTAWHQDAAGNWVVSAVPHLQSEAYTYSELAYIQFESLFLEQKSKLYKDEIDDVRLKALNHVVFYGTVGGMDAKREDIVKHAVKLDTLMKEQPSRAVPARVNTYIFARIHFREFWSAKEGVAVGAFDAATKALLDLQLSKKMDAQDEREAKRLEKELSRFI